MGGETSRRYYHKEGEVHFLLSHCHLRYYQYHSNIIVYTVQEVMPFNPQSLILQLTSKPISSNK